MKLLRIALIATVLALIIPALPVNAEDSYQFFGLGPRIGLMKVKDADDVNVLYGGFVRLNLIPAITVEGAVDYRKSKVENSDVEVTQTPVYASVLFNLMSSKSTHPYLIGGIGWYNVKIEGKESHLEIDTSENTVGYHLGIGLEAPLSNKIHFTGDFKYNFVNIELKETDTKIDADGWLINAGIVFYLF